MNLDNLKIKTNTYKNKEYGEIIAADTTISLNGKVLPYITGFNLKHNIDDLECPILELDIAIFRDMLEFEGEVNLKLKNIKFENKNIEEQVYKKLKNKYS